MTLATARVLASARAWPGLAALRVFVAACGPEAGVVPKTGIYHFEVAMIENTCDPIFDELFTELFSDPTGCRRESVEVEVLDERTLQARLTTSVARYEACPPIMRPPGRDTLAIDCVVTREYTYTLVE